MLNTLRTNEKMYLQSRNYVLNSQIFGKNKVQNTVVKVEINSPKFIPDIYN